MAKIQAGPTFALLLIICSLSWSASAAFGEDFGECLQRCNAEYTDCINQPPAPEPEVQDAKMASCDRLLAICQAECQNLKPPEAPPEAIENNPNIIRK